MLSFKPESYMYFIHYGNKYYFKNVNEDGYVSLSILAKAKAFSSKEEAKKTLDMGLRSNKQWAHEGVIVFIHPLNRQNVCLKSLEKYEGCACQVCLISRFMCDCGTYVLITKDKLYPEHNMPE